MYTCFYTEKKKFSRYDLNHYILYLNEEVTSQVDEETEEEVSGYTYTGDFPDGGTLIKAKEPTYGCFVSGLIRLKYSQDDVEAILLNIQSGNKERISEFNEKLEQLNKYRQQCKNTIKQMLNM